MKKYINLLSIFLCFITLHSCSKDAESFTGNIIGKVTDTSSDETLQGVTITITPEGLSRTTGSDGVYEFKDLEPRQYEIQAKKSGYVTNTKTVSVIIGKDSRGDIQLAPIKQEGKLELSVSSLNFSSKSSALSFDIINNGNASFNWNISGLSEIEWIEIKPTSGTLAAGKKNAVQVNLLRDRLTEDKEATIIINANKESVPLKITAEIEKKSAKMQINTNTLNFGTEYSSLTFEIKNIGNAGLINWGITGIDKDWLKVSPTNGTTAMGKSSAVKVEIDRTKLEGKQSTSILVNADGESLSVIINAEEKLPERYLQVTPTELSLGTSNSKSVNIISYNGATSFQIYTKGNASWLSIDKVSGTIQKYDPHNPNTITTLTVNINRTGLTAGDYNCTLIVHSDLGDIDIPVSMTVEDTQSSVSGTVTSCNSNLQFTIISSNVSGTTGTIEMKVKNTSNYDIDLRLNGGSNNSYAYDDLGNKYNYNNLQVAFSNNSYTNYAQNGIIPSGTTVKFSIRLFEINSNAGLFSNVTIKTNQSSDLVLKNVSIEGRTPSGGGVSNTSGTVISCSDKLNIKLLDCVYGSNHTLITFNITNTNNNIITLRLNGGGNNSIAYDDQGNQYGSSNLNVSFDEYYSPYAKESDIPSGTTVKGYIKILNVSTNANEFSNVTIKTNQSNDLIFKNVIIRK